MSRRLQQSYNSLQTNKIPIINRISSGVVVDVILDDTHSKLLKVDDDSKELYTEKETDIVGCAIIRPLSDNTSSENQLFTYQPLNPSLLELPLIGETVEIYNIGNVKYYRRYTHLDINTGGAVIDANKQLYSKTEKSKGGSDYSTVSQTGTTNSSSSSDRSTKLGEHFEPQQVNKLKFYEGDSILQSRFGQSIRFSAYNNEENSYSPSLIIRNRQNDESLNNLKPFDLVEEDLNKDGSIIAITSQDYKIPFQPGLIDDGGSSNFKTTPIKFELPEEYVGQDQILINSERIILSSKANEMMFFSKGNYGFISDGKFTIDNGEQGADLDFGGEVNITTDRNNSNFYIKTGKGNVWVNTNDNGESKTTGQKEPFARGETLVQTLDKLITAITNQIYATPSGPTAKGPLNVAEFEAIRAELDTIKSTLNFTE
jgi:hypothetical protein